MATARHISIIRSDNNSGNEVFTWKNAQGFENLKEACDNSCCSSVWG